MEIIYVIVATVGAGLFLYTHEIDTIQDQIEIFNSDKADYMMAEAERKALKGDFNAN